MIDLKNVSKTEVYRYMGFRDEIPELHIQQLCETVIEEVATAASPKFCFVDSEIKVSNSSVTFKTFNVVSDSLSKHLCDCEDSIIFAATLGSGVDIVIYKYSLLSPVKAVAAQAAATAMIEAYADYVCESLADAERKNNLFLTPRFSPGYGDFSLDHQADILNILNASKQIGLCLTDADMLTPVKSITAVVGKTKNEVCKKHKCSECQNQNCSYKSL